MVDGITNMCLPIDELMPIATAPNSPIFNPERSRAAAMRFSTMFM